MRKAANKTRKINRFYLPQFLPKIIVPSGIIILWIVVSRFELVSTAFHTAT